MANFNTISQGSYVNLDNLTTPGLYSGQMATNAPKGETSTPYTLIVSDKASNSTAGPQQIFISYRTDKLYTRYKDPSFVDGPWCEWTVHNRIDDQSITNAKLGGYSVDARVLDDYAVTEKKLAGECVTNAKIAENAVDGYQIIEDEIETRHLRNNTVTTEKIRNSAVSETKLASAAVTSPKLASAAVTNTKIANGVITSSKIANGTITEANLSSAVADRLATDYLPAAQFTGQKWMNGDPIYRVGISMYMSTLINMLDGDPIYNTSSRDLPVVSFLKNAVKDLDKVGIISSVITYAPMMSSGSMHDNSSYVPRTDIDARTFSNVRDINVGYTFDPPDFFWGYIDFVTPQTNIK